MRHCPSRENADVHINFRKNSFISELKRLGWKIRGDKKTMIPPLMSRMLEENVNFSNIFNNYPFKKIDERISLPA